MRFSIFTKCIINQLIIIIEWVPLIPYHRLNNLIVRLILKIHFVPISSHSDILRNLETIEPSYTSLADSNLFKKTNRNKKQTNSVTPNFYTNFF